MHFNIYIDEQIGRELNEAAQFSGKSRNALIREAIAQWLHKSKSKWPQEVLSFRGVANPIKLEECREKDKSPKKDPLV